MTDSRGLERGYRWLTDLLGNPTPLHLITLYLPPVLFACGVLLTAAVPRRSRLLLS